MTIKKADREDGQILSKLHKKVFYRRLTQEMKKKFSEQQVLFPYLKIITHHGWTVDVGSI